MDNIRIGARLLLGFGVVVLLSITLGVYAMSQHSSLQRLSEEMDRRDFLALRAIQAIAQTEDQMRLSRHMAMLSAFLRKEKLPGEAAELLERRWLQAREQSLRQMADLAGQAAGFENSALTPQRGAAWRRLRSALDEAQRDLSAFAPDVERLFDLINAGNLQEAAGRMQEVERAALNYQNRLSEAQKAVQEQIQLGRSEVNEIASDTRRSVFAVLVITGVAGVLFALIIHRSITKPLHEFVEIVDKVGQGNLTVAVPTGRPDELGDLGRSLDRMVKGLRDVAIQTRLVAESLNTATAEILASTQEQAASTAEQAAAVQQANATMAQISQSGSQISERARQVSNSAGITSNASNSGLLSVRNTASIMESIREQAEAVAENVIALSEKTQAVGDIITSVNDIAEQSHLLALNAAIQAAVAGEQGRSFAVVAHEMKNLAAQSKQATVQVRSILGDIQKGITGSVMLTEEAVKRVESGRQQAGVAEKTIRELTENLEESIRAFQQIVGGSSQQQIGFEQVTQAFRNIGIASQETATSTRQSEKAAANLSSLALQLRNSVERYIV